LRPFTFSPLVGDWKTGLVSSDSKRNDIPPPWIGDLIFKWRVQEFDVPSGL
jgi:hypothetical protein